MRHRLALPVKWLSAAFCLYAVSLLISMATMSIGLAVAAFALIASAAPLFSTTWPAEWRSRPVRGYLRAALFLAWACVMSLMIAWFFPLSFQGRTSEIHLVADMVKAFYLFLPLLFFGGLLLLPPERRADVLGSWIVAYGVLCGVAVVQHFTGWPRPQFIPGQENRFHATLFLGHHLSVASIFLFPTFFCLEAALDPQAVLNQAVVGELRRDHWLARIPRQVWAVLGCAGLLTLILTYSRNAWVSVPVAGLVWILWAMPRRLKLPVAVGVGLIVVAAALQPAVQRRFGDALGIGTRAEIWEANLHFLKERPLTGTGWHHNLELSGFYLLAKHPETQNVFSGHAHNNLLEMLASTGILGTVAWLAWCGFVLWYAWCLAARGGHRVARGLFCAWIAFQLNGLTQVNFWESKVLHSVMWTTAWMLLWARSAEKKTQTPALGGSGL